ncbi:polysialyltransferase family glycosyltransferase [Paeniglutamicibacter sp. MACA_103]|uniref:polysialyltransferase family glycosyltransferase n=1 Tax=Paeniglutamicibacter sp. MACA_103 TaxID=3377337 RepID=UPI003892D1CE
MIQLIQASAYFQVVSLAAMVDAGLLPDAERRVLVLVNGSQMPEITTPLRENPGFDALAARFDDVVDLGELLWPRRPGQFNPRNEELPLFEKLLRHRWGLGEERVSLVLESIQVNPAQALARIFFDAPISVHSDGLMSYGPTRNKQSMQMLQRLRETIHIDLVPGLEPMLLLEAPVQRKVLRLESLAAVFAELAADVDPAELDLPSGAALVVGQYLGSLGILDAAAELELHHGMLLAAQDAGASEVVFKPHPSSGPTAALQLRARAESLGLGFRILQTDLLAETVITLMKPLVVISCFSTALISARYMLGTPVIAVGTGELLQELSPYQNSNRIPVSIVDALLVQKLPTPAEAGPNDELTPLLRAVAYCMQYQNLPGLREEAAAFLAVDYSRFAAHFKRRRLAALDLPPTWAHPTRANRRRAWGRSIKRRALRAGSRSLEKLARKLHETSSRVSR